MQPKPGILFTAFEPSGDALASPLIRELVRRNPDRPVYALGGPLMERAGAQLIETTTTHAKMLLGAASLYFDHKKRVARLRRWMADHPLAAVVPTDSPSANWFICKLTRQAMPQARIVHLVAPQLWAWGQWRINKMRRLSDRALCLWPFEIDWFEQRGVASTFVGHPLFDPDAREAITAGQRDQQVQLPGEGNPKLAVLPGSRGPEVKANWPMMRQAIAQLRASHPGLRAVVALGDENRLAQVREMVSAASDTDPDAALAAEGIDLVCGVTQQTIDWSDAVLTKSGTATVVTMSRGKPMVVVYNVSRLAWTFLGQFLVASNTFSLPNILGESMGMGRVVPELMPHFGQVPPVVKAVDELLADPQARQQQQLKFERIAQTLGQTHFVTTAADAIEQEIKQTAVQS